MPTLTGTLTAVTGGSIDTSRVRRAYVRAPQKRGSLDSAGGLVTTVPVPVPTSGELSLDLEPGPAILVVDTLDSGQDVFDLYVTADMTLITEALDEAAPAHERSWAESQMVQLRAAAVTAAAEALDAAIATGQDRDHIETLRQNLIDAAEQNAAPHLTQAALNATYAPRLSGEDWISPQHFGAKADARELDDITTTAASPQITCPSAQFDAGDVGKTLSLAGPGIIAFTTTITSVQSATTATLGQAPTASTTEAMCIYGTDDTAAVQAAIDACPIDGIVNGLGGTFLARTVLHRSNLRYRRATFWTIGGSQERRCPVTIDGVAEPKKNLDFAEWSVNGKREYQTGITAAEGGGRHGYRIVGDVKNVRIADSFGINCASDGLAIYHAVPGVITPALPGVGLFQDITSERCRWNNNHRHGASADSITRLRFVDSELVGNGLAAARGTGEGSQPALQGGSRYGNGIDIETYGQYEWCGLIEFIRTRLTGNARGGVLVYFTQMDAAVPGFVQNGPIRFVDSHVDSGVVSGEGNTGAAITVIPQTAYLTASSRHVSLVELAGTRVEGGIIAKSVSTLIQRGGSHNGYPTGNLLGTLDALTTAVVDVPGRSRVYATTNAVATYVTTDDERFLPASQLEAVAGSPTRGFYQSRPVWTLPAAGGGVGAMYSLPDGWERVEVRAVWTSDTLAGSTYLQAGEADSTTTLAAPFAQSAQVAAPAAAGTVMTSTLMPSRTIGRGQRHVQVVRLSASNTLAGDVQLLGIRLIKKP